MGTQPGHGSKLRIQLDRQVDPLIAQSVDSTFVCHLPQLHRSPWKKMNFTKYWTVSAENVDEATQHDPVTEPYTVSIICCCSLES
jgi:hypothetical protein